MVPQPSTDSAGSRTLTRRRYLDAGIVAASLAGVPVVVAQSDPEPPGVVERRTYENLRVTGTAAAHGEGRVLVGRSGSPTLTNEPVRVALVDRTGVIEKRTEITPDLPQGHHATPEVVRTEDGYAVAAGPWLARLETDLSVRSIGKSDADGTEVSQGTTLVNLPDGFVAASDSSYPNHYYARVFGFASDGTFRWHRTFGEEGSKSLGFLLPDGDGSLVGGSDWVAELSPDGSSRRVQLPEEVRDGYYLRVGVRDDDGLVCCNGNAMARLTEDYELDWTRDYPELGEEQASGMLRTNDGGFLFRTNGEAVGDVRLSKTGPDGELRWTHNYRIGTDPHAEPRVLVERSPGEYLLAGGYHLSSDGWAIYLPEDSTSIPTASPTSAPTETETPDVESATPTATTSTPTATTSAPEATRTTGPGFSFVAGGVALGIAALRGIVHRQREE